MIEFESTTRKKNQKSRIQSSSIRIKVLGVGGAGCNIISRVYSETWDHIDFVAIDSCTRTLGNCNEVQQLQLGSSITHGWGTGEDKELARRITEESEEKIKDILEGTDLLFLVSGLGKGIGTGAPPEVLKVAKEMGILSIGFFVLPFYFEGKKRANSSRETLENLWEITDGQVVISNNVLLHMGKEGSQLPLSVEEAFGRIDDLFELLLQSIEHILLRRGVISLDFADISSFLSKGHLIILNKGKGNGEGYAEEAVEKAINSPFWGKIPLEKADGILLNIQVKKDFSLSQLERILVLLQKKMGNSTSFNFGIYPEETISEEVILTLMVSTDRESKPETEQSETEQPEKYYQQDTGSKVYDEQDLDVPTFLRKQHG